MGGATRSSLAPVLRRRSARFSKIEVRLVASPLFTTSGPENLRLDLLGKASIQVCGGYAIQPDPGFRAQHRRQDRNGGEWTATVGQPPRIGASRELLALAFAWWLQERQYGGLKPAVERKLLSLAKVRRRKSGPGAVDPATTFRSGTVIVKGVGRPPARCHGAGARLQLRGQELPQPGDPRQLDLPGVSAEIVDAAQPVADRPRDNQDAVERARLFRPAQTANCPHGDQRRSELKRRFGGAPYTPASHRRRGWSRNSIPCMPSGKRVRSYIKSHQHEGWRLVKTQYERWRLFGRHP